MYKQIISLWATKALQRVPCLCLVTLIMLKVLETWYWVNSWSYIENLLSNGASQYHYFLRISTNWKKVEIKTLIH